MFPPDEENPVLNPKPKSDEQVRKDKEEREESIKFLRYRSVTAPMKAPPPGQLLTLVGAFLTSYGFNHASRLYTAQCKARKKLDAWDHELDAKLPKGHPDLVKMYRDWHKEYQLASESEDSANSSDEGGSEDNEKQTSKSQKSKVNKQQEKEDETSSSSGSDDSDDSDARPQKKRVAPKIKTNIKIAKATSPSTSASSSSSESDADDEKETTSARAEPPKPTANALNSKSKRKASSPDTSVSESTSEASSSEDGNVPPAKKTKVGAEKKSINAKVASKPSKAAKEPAKATVSKKTAVATSSSDSSTSSESENAKGVATKQQLSDSTSEEDSSSSDSDAAAPPNLATTGKINVPAKKSPESSIPTDSSATLDIASDKKTSSSSTSSSFAAEVDPPVKQEPKPSKVKSEPEPAPKRKRSLSPHSARQAMTPQKIAKKTDTRFQRVPKDTKVDPKLASNAYVSYDYADRAHKDLIVTKGKDFTKEKNKKKRGSYRGGAIDVDGRNGIKFED